jgi:hypothetical protein
MNDAAQRLTDTLHLAVDHGPSFEAMIAAGRYDWISDDITSDRFPIRLSDTARVEIKILHFDRCITSEDAIKAIMNVDAANPRELAEIGHLLSFGTTYPEEQGGYPIIALGSLRRSAAAATCRTLSGMAQGAASASLGGTAAGTATTGFLPFASGP